MKIGIALPHTNNYYERLFVETFFCMRRPPNCVLLTPKSDGPIDAVRNELCQQAILMECTHIFWCDTDQTYPSDALEKLIAYNLPIVCAKVHRRKTFTSALDGIPGIGPRRKSALLRQFGSVQRIGEASVDELMAATGLSRDRAQRIKEYL